MFPTACAVSKWERSVLNCIQGEQRNASGLYKDVFFCVLTVSRAGYTALVIREAARSETLAIVCRFLAALVTLHVSAV